MFDYIKGPLVRTDIVNEEIVIDLSGAGFRISVPARLIDRLPPPGEEVHVFVDLIAGEKDFSLYGFENEGSRSLFRLVCRQVKNVGPSTAMRILSAGTASDIKQAVLKEQDGFFSSVKGIGKKTAQRIVHELRDSITDLAEETVSEEPRDGDAGIRHDAVKTLVALGIPENTAVEKVHDVLRQEEITIDVEELVKRALKH